MNKHYKHYTMASGGELIRMPAYLMRIPNNAYCPCGYSYTRSVKCNHCYGTKREMIPFTELGMK